MTGFDWLKRLFSRRRAPDRLFALIDERGFTQVRGSLTVSLEWGDITGVFAYKKDCLTSDQIRVVIRGSDAQLIECSEDDQNLQELGLSLGQHLSLLVPDWHLRLIAAPAFQATWTTVYERPTSVAEEND